MNRQTDLTTRVIVLFCGFLMLASGSLAETQLDHSFSLGYRSISHDGSRLATPYAGTDSSVTATAEVGYASDWGHFHFDADYRGKDEHTGEFHIETGPNLQLTLLHQKFVRNLERIPYASAAEGSRQDVPGEFDFQDTDPAKKYGFTVEQHAAQARVRFGTYPAHIRIGVRQLNREGVTQLRSVDESCSTSTCHFKSTTRKVDQEINDVAVQADAHIGPVDLIVSHEYREFKDNAGAPTASFEEHFPRPAGSYEYDAAPKSRYMASTIMAHSSLSGGIVAAGSATLGIRENRGSLDDISGIDAKTEFFKTAGDLTWIPSEKLAVTLRHRYLQMNSSNSSALSLSSYNTTVVPKEGMDLQRTSLQTTLSYRPTHHLTLKAETEFRQIFRGNTLEEAGLDPGNAQSSSVAWNLPEEENISRLKLGFFARPLGNSRLKIRGWTLFQRSDDPAYGTSASTLNSGFVGVDWMPGTNWGTSLSGKVDFATNNDHAFSARDDLGGSTLIVRDREVATRSLAALVWINPAPAVTSGLHLGYVKNTIEQGVLFGNDQYNSTTSENFSIASDADYDQEVQTVSAYLNWTLAENISTRLNAHYILSTARFAPEFADRALAYDGGTLTASASGLSELGMIDIEQTGLSLGVDYDLSSAWRSGLVLAYDDYNDRINNRLDCTVKSVSVNLATSW